MLAFGIVAAITGMIIIASAKNVNNSFEPLLTLIFNRPVTINIPFFITGAIILCIGIFIITFKIFFGKSEEKNFNFASYEKVMCSRCSFIMNRTDLFCKKCGAKRHKPAAKMANNICTICQNILTSGCNFCNKCGTRVLTSQSRYPANKKTCGFTLFIVFMILAPTIQGFIQLLSYYISNLPDRSYVDVDYFIYDTCKKIMFSFASAAILLILNHKGIISKEKFKKRDAIVPVCVLLFYWVEAFFSCEILISAYYGSYANISYVLSMKFIGLFDISYIIYLLSLIFYALIKNSNLNLNTRKVIIFTVSLAAYYFITGLFLSTDSFICNFVSEEAMNKLKYIKPMTWINIFTAFTQCVYFMLYITNSAKNLTGWISNILTPIIMCASYGISIFIIITGHCDSLVWVSSTILTANIIAVLYLVTTASISKKRNKSKKIYDYTGR